MIDFAWDGNVKKVVFSRPECHFYLNRYSNGGF